MSRTPGDIDRPAPMLGQHNEQVFSGILGINREELDELEREGVIGTRPIYADIPPGAPLAPEERKNMAGQGRIRGYNPDYRKRLGIDP